MKDKIFVKWELKKRSFLVVKDKALFSEIKAAFKNILSAKKKLASKADAKNGRQILEKRPEKCIEKGAYHKNNRSHGSNKVLIQAMAEKKDEYYTACVNAETKLNVAAMKIRRQIVEDLKKEGYTFIEEVDSKITVLSDNEADEWVSNTYSKYRNSQHLFDAEKPTDMRHFSSNEDEMIKKCVESTKNDGVGFSFAMVPWNELMSQMPNRRLPTIQSRARSLFDENGDLIQCDNDGKEWTYDEDLIVWNAKIAVEPIDLEALSEKLGRKKNAIKTRMEQVAFDSSGKRITISDVRHIILDDPEKASAYLSTAKMKKEGELSERSLEMGCQEHGYKGYAGLGYCSYTTDLVGGIKVHGPSLHQAAATIGSGKRPADPKPIPGRKRRKYDASHRCKNSYCVNSQHLKWELNDANIHRRTCVGMVKFNIGGKVIMRKARECTCDGHCLDFISAP